MPIVRFRLFSTDNQTDKLLAALHGLDKVDRVEEVADEIHQRDDSSSLGLPDDAGPDFHCIEAHASSAAAAAELRDIVEATAHDISAVVEFVERF